MRYRPLSAALAIPAMEGAELRRRRSTLPLCRSPSQDRSMPPGGTKDRARGNTAGPGRAVLGSES